MTRIDQLALQEKVCKLYKRFANADFQHRALLSDLWRDRHVEYLEKGIRTLPASFVSLDSSRPWLCYWIVHSLALLGEQLDAELQKDIVEFLGRCQDPVGGGYGGGPGQMAHLATTYAAVCSLCTVGGAEALASINRDQVLNFLLRMKDPCGGFRLHDGGETDVRGSYTAIAVAYLLDILVPAVVQNVGEYIASCQTYEGGIGGEPGAEAHGGYTFCGLATAIIVGEEDLLDLSALLNWVAFRQGSVEGGFEGRTNKLVDGCYSYWQGGVFPLFQQYTTLQSEDQEEPGWNLYKSRSIMEGSVDTAVSAEGAPYTAERLFPFRKSAHDPEKSPLFNSRALQAYLILCCQALNGGLIDKPGKSRDYYHTCYCLSGLSAAQHIMDTAGVSGTTMVFGCYSNLLKVSHPLLNVQQERFNEAYAYFCSLPKVR